MIKDFSFLTPDTLLSVYCLHGCVPDGVLDGCTILAGNWVEAGHSYLFFTKEADAIVMQLLERVRELTLLDHYQLTYRQWQGEQPQLLKVGKFSIIPPWAASGSSKGPLSVILDPGLVFGDGTHPTTADCLEAVETACVEMDAATMLDLGAGTGILAIGGALLGCRRVLAVEYTFLAARTARRNVIYNRLEDRILTVNGRAEDFAAVSADLLVANIGYSVIKSLVLSGMLKNHKTFILSGLLESEADRVIVMCAENGLHVSRQWGAAAGGWKTVMGHPA